MSNWEEQVNVSLDDIFDDNEEDIFTENDKEEVKEKIVEKKEINKVIKYLSDLDDYYSTEEQADLASKGIHLTASKEYYLEKKKKPIVRGKITKIFKEWLKNKHPDHVKYLKTEKKLVKEQKAENIGDKIKLYDKTMQNRCLFLYKLMGEKMEFTLTLTDEEIQKIEEIEKSLSHWLED